MFGNSLAETSLSELTGFRFKQWWKLNYRLHKAFKLNFKIQGIYFVKSTFESHHTARGILFNDSIFLINIGEQP